MGTSVCSRGQVEENMAVIPVADRNRKQIELANLPWRSKAKRHGDAGKFHGLTVANYRSIFLTYPAYWVICAL